MSVFKNARLGLGLWKAQKGEVGAAVVTALKSGYRLLDGAAAYGNEAEVGAAIAQAIKEGVCTRDEICVVSKLFSTHHVWKGDASRPEAGMRKTLSDLGLDSLDLYLMHWPFAFEQTELASIGGLRLADGTPNPKLVWEMEFLESWRCMVELKKKGLCKAIGVCNFTVEQLQKLTEAFPDEPPAVNQVELHPYLAQPELTAYCKAKGISLMAYSPLGSGDSYSGASFPAVGDGPFQCASGGASLLNNSVVGAIAARRGISNAQVLLAWSIAQGFVPLPKSVNPARIDANLAASNVTLPPEDLAELAALDCGFRYGIGYCKGHYDCPNAPWSK